jgi:hypothetical protein
VEERWFNMALGITITNAQFAILVAAGTVIRNLKKDYPAEYYDLSGYYDDQILRKSRNHYLDTLEA